MTELFGADAAYVICWVVKVTVILGKAAHYISDFYVVAVMGQQFLEDWPRTPTPGTCWVGKIGGWSIGKIILMSFVGAFLSYILLMTASTIFAFRTSALCIGLSFGILYPAFNILFIRLGGEGMRGTATSTYLTAWNIDIGVGIIFGSIIAGAFSYCIAYTVGTASVVIAILIFTLWVYIKHKHSA